MNPNEIRALSWKQPFATLMLHGKIETRTWPTKYRGLVLICASKQPYGFNTIKEIAGDYQYNRIMELIIDVPLHYGHAIAVGKLVDCRPMWKDDEDACFVQYFPSALWCHVYEDVRAIEPMPFKGKQGWGKLDQEFINRIKFL
ncbi:hypothetical protein UFOVP1596_17 [uncultured Caudovirales phage]|uniref:ASCH domain-containing protein n=1 Tax=uncultured Caudovirales phage TaxID=2100421 RepID=A0A6J5SSF5_9CAUD|nr:hypothetical protein UFOVP1596_17 [uncultured Caudovirales phage]